MWTGLESSAAVTPELPCAETVAFRSVRERGAGGKVSCHVQRQLHSGQLEREGRGKVSCHVQRQLHSGQRGGGEGELPCAETVAFRSEGRGGR